MPFNQLTKNSLIIAVSLCLLLACDISGSNQVIDVEVVDEPEVYSLLNLDELPIRSRTSPETTQSIPHMQIDVSPVAKVHDEMITRVFSVPGIQDQASVVATWRGLWIDENTSIPEGKSLIGEREFAHIHADGSLHIMLDRLRAEEAVKTGWAVFHPLAVQGVEGWEGFVMLYTPQSIDELAVTFRLIVDGFNHATDQKLVAKDYYD